MRKLIAAVILSSLFVFQSQQSFAFIQISAQGSQTFDGSVRKNWRKVSGFTAIGFVGSGALQLLALNAEGTELNRNIANWQTTKNALLRENAKLIRLIPGLLKRAHTPLVSGGYDPGDRRQYYEILNWQKKFASQANEHALSIKNAKAQLTRLTNRNILKATAYSAIKGAALLGGTYAVAQAVQNSTQDTHLAVTSATGAGAALNISLQLVQKGLYRTPFSRLSFAAYTLVGSAAGLFSIIARE